MKKILVIGSPGSGKSTLSRRLADITRLELIHLDRLYWQAGWIEPDKSEWLETVKHVLSGESWIIEGNYSRTMDVRIEACDTVIFLDLPRFICTFRVIKRWFVYRKDPRPDMADGCSERFDPQFIKWVWTYPSRSQVNVLQRLDQVRNSKTVVTLQSRREIETFISSLSQD